MLVYLKKNYQIKRDSIILVCTNKVLKIKKNQLKKNYSLNLKVTRKKTQHQKVKSTSKKKMLRHFPKFIFSVIRKSSKTFFSVSHLLFYKIFFSLFFVILFVFNFIPNSHVYTFRILFCLYIIQFMTPV